LWIQQQVIQCKSASPHTFILPASPSCPILFITDWISSGRIIVEEEVPFHFSPDMVQTIVSETFCPLVFGEAVARFGYSPCHRGGLSTSLAPLATKYECRSSLRQVCMVQLKKGEIKFLTLSAGHRTATSLGTSFL